MVDAAVALHAVSKTFTHVVAVDGLSLNVPRGAIYGILGQNGAGKTTTIRMLVGILRPDSGTVRVLDSDDPSRIKGRLGYLPEEKGLYKKMRVLDLVAYFGRLKGMSRASAYSQGQPAARRIRTHRLARAEVRESVERHGPEGTDRRDVDTRPRTDRARRTVLRSRSGERRTRPQHRAGAACPQSHGVVVHARDGAGRTDLRRPDSDQSRSQVARRHAERHTPLRANARYRSITTAMVRVSKTCRA